MRVVSGSARGVPLIAPDGRATRPTTDRVKESIFNILQFELAGRRVLDLFAGSGALGIEALSRGAAACTFVDQSQAALKVVRTNLERTRLFVQASLFCGTYSAFLSRETTPFDLVFLDPPYASGFEEDAARLLQEHRLLSKDGIVMLEHERPAGELPGLVRGKTYRYGKTFVTFYRNEGATL